MISFLQRIRIAFYFTKGYAMRSSFLPAVISFRPIFSSERSTSLKNYPEISFLRKLYIKTLGEMIKQNDPFFTEQFDLELQHEYTDWILILDSMKIIGFIIVEELNGPESLFIRQCCIPPHLAEKSLSLNIVDFLFTTYPECKTCNLLLRKECTKAAKLLTLLNFRLSNFSYKGFDPKIYKGYTLKKS